MKVSINTKKKEETRIEAMYNRPMYFENEYEHIKVRTEPVPGAGQNEAAFKIFAKHDNRKEYALPFDSKLFLETWDSGKEISKTAYEKD